MPRGRASLKVIQPNDAAGTAPRAAGRRAVVAREAVSSSTQRIVESITAAIVGRRLMPGTKLSEPRARCSPWAPPTHSPCPPA